MQENECIENVPNCPPRDPITPIDFTDDGNGGNGGNTIAPKWDWEVVCLSDDGGQTKTTGVVVYDMLDPQSPVATLYIGQTDVTATHSIVNCETPLDREILRDCYQLTADPSVRFTRIQVLDLSVSPSVVLETFWQDADGNIVVAPIGVEPCEESVYVPHVNGCIETTVDVIGDVCNVVTNDYPFTSTSWLTQEKTADSGTGQYTILNTFDSSATADLFEAMINQAMTSESRIISNAIGYGISYLHQAQFVGVNRLSPTQAEYLVDFGAANDVPTPLTTPCVDPISDLDYTNGNQQNNANLGSLPLNTPTPIGIDITFTVSTYTVTQEVVDTTVTHTPAKQVVTKLADGTYLEEYRTQGDINTLIPFDNATDVFKNVCADTNQLPLTDCSQSVVVTQSLESSGFNFQPVTAIFGATGVVNMENYSVNMSNGLVVDGTLADVTFPDGVNLSMSIQDGSQVQSYTDFLLNTVPSAGTPTWNAGTDPTGATFIADLKADIQAALTALGLTNYSMAIDFNVNVSGTLDFQINFEGTEGVSAANYLWQITTDLGGSITFTNIYYEAEADYQFDASAIPGDPTAITFKVTANVPSGEAFIVGLNVNGVIGPGLQPYTVSSGIGTLTEYTYTLPVSGTDIFSGPYSLTEADLDVPIYGWIYSNISNYDGPATVQIDGASLEISYTDTAGGTTQVLATKGCNDDRRDDLLTSIDNKLGSNVATPNAIVITIGFVFASQGILAVKSFSVSGVNGSLWQISFDGGSTFQGSTNGINVASTWGQGDNSDLDVSQVVIQPFVSGEEVLITWEV